MDTLDALLTLAVTLANFVIWSDNLWHSGRLWSQYRDARSFRAFLIAILLELAALSFLLGSIVLALRPEWIEYVRALGLPIRGVYIVVGVFTFISWRRR